MPPTRVTPAKSQGTKLSARDQTWRHYSEVIERFRKLCRGDAALFEQADCRIKAKLVTAKWEAAGRPQITDALSLAKQMSTAVLDIEDERQVDALYRAKLAFRDRLAAVLGKADLEGWDAFYERCSTCAKVPNTVRQFELATATPPTGRPKVTAQHVTVPRIAS